MTIEPIINAKFHNFKESFEINNLQDGDAFERFVNYSILSNHQADAFGADNELLNCVCVGGHDDTGIDGIGIKINGLMVKDITEAEDIINKFKRVSIEFIFIQSKISKSFDSGEFIKFTSGVRDFLSNDHFQPHNKQIQNMIDIKDYVLSDDIVSFWESNPSIRAYYVALGKWRDSPHIKAHGDRFIKDIELLNSYEECFVHYIDAQALKTICDNNENSFTATIEVIDTMPLTEVSLVENSCVALCYANELISLLMTEEGMIRKTIFDDNVRDYQGTNVVNDEIKSTIENEPEKFALLNNGITIVCDEYKPNNRRITIKNPQIVNGCQTSHVLFYAHRKGFNVDKIPLHIKIIATNDLDTMNQIVRGTNRQNIVYDEAFETTKRFHRELEEFFNSVSKDYGRVFYERRSKQYSHDPRIKQIEKVNLRILTQTFIAVFFNKPHMSHRHELKLLELFSGKIYRSYQSKLPYLTVAILFSNIEKLLRTSAFQNFKIQSFHPHLLMIIREIVSGSLCNINNEKEVDKYCENLLETITNQGKLKKVLTEAIHIFDKSTDVWINDMKRSRDGRKDIEDFTLLLLDNANKEMTSQVDNTELYGTVVKVIKDRYGKYCGFIRYANKDYFFHSNNSSIDFKNIINSIVSFKIEENEINGREQATNVKTA